MRTLWCARWQLSVLAFALICMSLPGWTQTTPRREITLDAVTLNSTFLEVLSIKGAPSLVGPSVTSADEVLSYLDPQPDTTPVAIPGMSPGGMAVPGAPSMMPGSSMAPGMALPAKPVENYIVWCYPGKDAHAGCVTFVFFNRRGVVVGVVVNAVSPNLPTSISTASGVTIGTKLTEIVKKYDWPDPFTTVSAYYYCSYPAYNVTYALDQQNHKVVSMAIGLPFVVTIGQEGKTSPGMRMPGGGAYPGGAYPGGAAYPAMRY